MSWLAVDGFTYFHSRRWIDGKIQNPIHGGMPDYFPVPRADRTEVAAGALGPVSPYELRRSGIRGAVAASTERLLN
ncbi:MAG: hypothetical protein ABSA53_02760 [Streptosporangiaceae bacterium]|jgi:hypothetical protein